MKKIGSLLFTLAVAVIFTAVASPPANAICQDGPPLCAACKCSSSCAQECQSPGCIIKTCGEHGKCEGSDSCTPSCIEGTSGGDTITGTSGNDCINGNGGADTIYGNSGNDTCHGNDGNDTINGGSGDDFLYGDAGDDYLDGGSGGWDYLDGGSGTDTCVNGEVYVSCP